MVKIKQGDLLEAKEDIICHQVNVQGIMGGGIARQLADKYAGLEETYAEYCHKHKNRYMNLCGNVFYYQATDKTIANMFSQQENFDTDYFNMKVALKDIAKFAKHNELSVCIPYRYRLRNSKRRLEYCIKYNR